MTGSGFHLTLQGDRYADAFNYQTKVLQNTDVLQKSVYNFIKNSASLVPKEADLAANSEYEHKYTESKFTGNLLNKLSASTYSSLSNNLLGSKKYWGVTMF